MRDRIVAWIASKIITTFASKEYQAYCNVSTCLGVYLLEDQIMKLDTLSAAAQKGLSIYEKRMMD